jgi:hypothetical protein
METQQKKVISFDELLSRAAASDLAQKFPISSNYYFMLLSRHIVELSKKKDLFEKVVYKFIFDNILLPEGPQKERMINFCIQNDNLNVFKFKPLLEKFNNYQLIYLDETKELMKNCPDTHKNFNYEKAIFEHNLYSLSRVFDNISFDSAEKFLKMKINNILNYTLKMIVDGNIKGSIDEKNKFILFYQDQNDISSDFDKQILNFCLKAKKLGEYIKSH